MKRTLLIILGAVLLCIVSYAATYMHIETKEGKEDVYAVDDVSEVTFWNDPEISHAYVDLGLPSGTLWATCNIGATKPEEYGDYFAWGEIEPKEVYDWSTYKYATTKDGELDSLTKKYNESVGLSSLLPEDDAATANWGSECRMPDYDEMKELCDECYMVWTNNYKDSKVSGVIFYKAKSADDKGKYIKSSEKPSSAYSTSNDIHIFFPNAGLRDGADPYNAGKEGWYWSSLLYVENGTFEAAYDLNLYESNAFYYDNSYRYYGLPVRAVCAQKAERKVYKVNFYTSDSILIETQDVMEYTSAKEVQGPKKVGFEFSGWSTSVKCVTSDLSVYAVYNTIYVDLGLRSGTLWAAFNVGATKPEEYGDYFAWGETEPKKVYDWSTYKYATTKDGKSYSKTKYIYSDSLFTLLPEDDAATANWGEEWRMPNHNEMKELCNGCYMVYTDSYNGSDVGGIIFYKWKRYKGEFIQSSSAYSTSNDVHVFFPAAGFCDGGKGGEGWRGSYWSSSALTLDDYNKKNPYPRNLNDPRNYYNDDVESYAYVVKFMDGYAQDTLGSARYYGYSVRAVRAEKTAYVDLGLPSGTLWATSNVGATKPEEAGDYFAWGETEPKAVYDLSTYKYATTKDGKLQSYTRYNESDGLSTLLPEDDAVTANWGSDWRMPTIDEMKELIEYCDYKWTMVNGVYGAKYTGPSGRSVFFPAVGLRKGSKVSLVGKYGNYWSSLLYVNDENYACRYYFDDSGAYLGNDGSSERYYGFPVRAVRTKK